MSDEVFTPVTRDGKRQDWKQSNIIGKSDDLRGFGYKYNATVDNKTYRVYGAMCDLGPDCCCDAVALDEDKDHDLITAIDELVELGMLPEFCG